MKKLIYLNIILFAFLNLSYAQYTQNYAASFNGTNSYIAVPSHSELSPTAAITIEAWVFPTALPVSGCIVGKNYLTSYYFGIESTGRFVFFPKGGSGNFLRSRVTGVVRMNQWTHIAGTYDGTNTRLYVNGILDTSRTGISGAVGTNFDSLFIGADRLSGVPAFFFQGRLDNVRIWRSARTATEIFSHMFIPLNIYQLAGSYSSLAASYQLDNSASDFSGPAINNGFTRNISYVNFTNKSVNYIDYNDNLVFNGTTDYCSHYNIGQPFNTATAITLECWIKRDTTNQSPSAQNIVNKSGSTTRYNYALFLFNTGQVVFAINNGTYNLQTSALVTNAQWTHVAGTYNSTTGSAVIYVNGSLAASTTFSGNPLIDNNTNDSLYFGGIGATSYSGNKFRGQLDEIRIWRVVRTAQQIKDFMYKHPKVDSQTDSLAIFDFDYVHSGFKYGQDIYPYGLKLIGSTFINSAHANTTKLSSPMLSDATAQFYDPAYTTSFRRFFIPDANSSGISDSILISGIGDVNNLKVFLMMSHTYTQDLRLNLTSPSGTTITLLNTKGGNSNDIMTIFSDDADSIASSGFSSLNGPGISPPFSPEVKPDQPLSTFNGQNRNGWWKLKCVDIAGGDIGYVHGWGINLLSYKTLHITAFLQGFYNAVTDKMKSDTVQMLLRIPLPPYPIVDSSKAVLDSNGNGIFYLNKVNNGYRVLKHRNSIETWTPVPAPFTGDSSSYDFTTAASQAYGNNQIQVDASPVRFAIYGGDVNQDGSTDALDLSMADNDVFNFVTGYVKSDVNGDNTVDANDLGLIDNNAINFVSRISP